MEKREENRLPLRPSRETKRPPHPVEDERGASDESPPFPLSPPPMPWPRVFPSL